MKGKSKKLDGFSQDRGQEATRQCPFCLSDGMLKGMAQFETVLINDGDPEAIAMAARVRDRIDKAYAHIRTHQLEPKVYRHAGHELGARIFTLTYSPKWFDDATARNKMTTAIGRLLQYYKNEIVEFKAVGETGKNGLSHIHGYYLLAGGKKMTDKNFRRAWEHWNPAKPTGKDSFEGGHHANVKSESDYVGYIAKENNPWYEYNQNNASQDCSTVSDEEGSQEPSSPA